MVLVEVLQEALVEVLVERLAVALGALAAQVLQVLPQQLQLPFVSSGDLTIEAPQQVMESGQFTSAVQRAIARLAGANVAAAAVELIIGCLAGRRLIVSRTIDVCFEIQSDNRDVSEEICRRLSYVQRQDVQRVIAFELLGSSISPDEVRVVYYRANRNPQAPTNPNAGPIANPYQPGGGAINLG